MKGPLLACLVMTACGSETPAPPTAPAPLPPPVADVHSIGTLSVDCVVGECRFSGALLNAGPNCATAIRGVTRAFDSMRKEVGIGQWSVPHTLRLAEQVIYSGCCFEARVLTPGWTYRTDVFSTPTRCE